MKSSGPGVDLRRNGAKPRRTVSGSKIASIVLAAGLSSRFGSLKQLAKWKTKGKSLIQNALDIANHSKSDYVYVVLGHGSNEIMKSLALGKAQMILNKEYSTGLSSSVRASVANLPPDCEAAILIVADQPFLTSKLIDRLIEVFESQKRNGIVCLAYEGEPRNPAVFGKKFFPLLRKLSGDTGARDFVKSHLDDVTLINVKNEKVFLDVDTFSSLRKLRRESNRNREKS